MIFVVLWILFVISAAVAIICAFNGVALSWMIMAAILTGVLLLIYYVVKQAVKDAVKEMDKDKKEE